MSAANLINRASVVAPSITNQYAAGSSGSADSLAQVLVVGNVASANIDMNNFAISDCTSIASPTGTDLAMPCNIKPNDIKDSTGSVGTSGQYLGINGSGNLAWSIPTGGLSGTPIKILPSQTFTTNTTGTPSPLAGSSITIAQPGYYAYCVNYKIDPNGGSGMAYIIPILNTLTPLVNFQNDTYIGNVVQSRHTFYTIIQQPLNIGDTISLSHAEGAGLASAINGVVWVSWIYLGNSTF